MLPFLEQSTPIRLGSLRQRAQCQLGGQGRSWNRGSNGVKTDPPRPCILQVDVGGQGLSRQGEIGETQR